MAISRIRVEPRISRLLASYWTFACFGFRGQRYEFCRTIKRADSVSCGDTQWTIRKVGKDGNGGSLPNAERTRALQQLRRTSWQFENQIAHLATGDSLEAVGRALLASNPFGCTAHLQETLPIPNFTDDDAVYTDFWTRLQHRLLIRSCVYPLPGSVISDETVGGSYHAQLLF